MGGGVGGRSSVCLADSGGRRRENWLDGQTDADADDGWVAAVARAPCEGVKCEDKSGRMGSCATALMAALLCVGFVSGGNPDAKRLYDDLLSNYNKLVRPVVNVSEAVTVRLKLKLSQLIDVVSE